MLRSRGAACECISSNACVRVSIVAKPVHPHAYAPMHICLCFNSEACAPIVLMHMHLCTPMQSYRSLRTLDHALTHCFLALACSHAAASACPPRCPATTSTRKSAPPHAVPTTRASPAAMQTTVHWTRPHAASHSCTALSTSCSRSLARPQGTMHGCRPATCAPCGSRGSTRRGSRHARHARARTCPTRPQRVAKLASSWCRARYPADYL
jgi:hypothetical protein